MVTPGYFETMGIPRIAGRDFGGETASGPRTAVVNRAFAERFFGGENPVGQQVTTGGGVTYQIIGVAGNVKTISLGEDLTPVLYRSLQQNVAAEPPLLGYTLVVHTARNPAAMKEAVRGQIHALDRSMAVFNEETMEEHVRSAFFLPRLAATLFGVFGGIGLVLATVGLYGVMSYAVSRRTREIGIRMAMGAQPGTVERFVLRQGLVLTLLAVALGWPAAWILAKLSASFLYGIYPHDALTFAIVPAFLSRDRPGGVLDSGSARRVYRTHAGIANRVEGIHVLKPDLLARPIQRCVESDGRQRPMRSLASSGRFVGYPEITS